MKTILIILLLSFTNAFGHSNKDLSIINGTVTKFKAINSSQSEFYLKTTSKSLYINYQKEKLRYPEAFQKLKNNQNVIVYGHYNQTADTFSVVLINLQYSKAEFEKVFFEKLPENEVIINNEVTFDTYTNQDSTTSPLINFTVEVINNGKNPLPALSPSNNSHYINDKSLLTLYINGKQGGLSIYNGRSFEYEMLLPNSGASDQESWILTEDSGIRRYGDIITIQWEYLGVFSKKVKVDLVNRKIVD